MTELYLSQAAVVFLCELVLAATITGYLLSVKQKSTATWLLAGAMAGFSGFFASLVIISSTMTGSNTIAHVIQILAFLGGLTCALGFAYHFIEPPGSRAWKWVLGLAAAATLFWTGLIAFDVATDYETPSREVSLGVAGTVLVITLMTFVVHLQKTARLSGTTSGGRFRALRAIVRPVGRSARAHRAFGFLSLLILAMAVLVGLGTTQLLSDDTVNTIVLVGFLAYLFSVVITYVNHAPEPTSFQVKIVAFALATVVAVLGITTILVYDRLVLIRASNLDVPRASLQFQPAAERGYRIRHSATGVDPDLGEQLEIENGGYIPTAIGFPFPFAGTRWDSLYVDDDGVVTFGGGFSMLAEFQRTELPAIAPYFVPLHPERGGGVYVKRDTSALTVTWNAVPHTLADEPVTVQLRLDSTGAVDFRYGYVPLTAVQGERGIYPQGKAGKPAAIESDEPLPAAIPPGAAFVQAYGEGLRAFIHDRVAVMAWIVLGSAAFILLVFPFLLRSSVTRPLRSLVEGMRRVNSGDLNTKVNIAVRDELGNLALNFNRMTESLKHAEERLRAHAQELEERVQERTAELRRSLDELKATQTQLVQQEKLASLGALTAGIAHEIKNPLNFVNNFAALSVELADELADEIARLESRLGEDDTDELQAIIDDLKINAEKINEHGKRADGIVRSMLLHSRGKSGERQETDLNALLNEYVNLAFHGMRAQDPQFNCEIERDFDEKIGEVDVVPQDVGRVFINLLNNAFYAVNDKAKATDGAYKPCVSVSTRRADDEVEIVIRDNGPGIPESLRKKVFEPFFTTKPTGSGTGLGLSLSHEIVTREHGGRMLVESEEGEATTFTITLPIRINETNPSTP